MTNEYLREELGVACRMVGTTEFFIRKCAARLTAYT